MRYVSTAAAIVVAFSTFASPTAFGALNLSITNYQSVSNQRASLTQWYVTFKADLVNPGPALPAITATITSKSSNVQVVAGQGALHFSPVPANGRVTSADSFTLLVDRSVVFDWNQVEWSFMNPVANAGPNQTAPVTSTVTLDASACSNPSGMGTLSYSWAFQAVPPGSSAQLSRPNTPSPSFVVDAAGTYKVKLTVSNGVGSDSATVAVSTINSPPVAAAGANQTVALGGTVSLDGSKSSDVDGDLLRHSWSFISLPAKSAAVLFGAQTASPTFVADAPGTYKAQLIVNDGKVDSQPSTVLISTANTPPVANAGINQTVVAGMFVQLNGAGSTDVDGDPLAYRWSFNSLPAGSTAALANPTAVNPTFTADKAGTYIVQLIVNDGKIDSAASTVTITTNAVQAPTAQAGPDVTVHAGARVQLNGSGTDPQNFPLSFSWSLPTRPSNSAASLSATNISNPTFVADLPGTYAAQLVVSNGTLSSAPSTVTITTTDTPPVANPGPNQVAYVGDTVYLDGNRSSDADHDPITAYSWTFTSKPDGSEASLSGANTPGPTFIADLPGTYVVQLIVSDAFASSQAKTVTIDVGTRTMAVTPSPLSLYNSPGTLNIRLSPIPTSPVPVTLSADTPGIATFAPNPATVPANSSGVNVSVTPTSIGTTSFSASATGYYSSTGTITVTKPSISIALNGGATAVGLTYKACGGITLNAPAPPGGAIITLSSSAAPDGAVSFDSNTATIGEGGQSAAFCATGAQIGAATISGTASGYNSGSQTVQVIMLGSVSLPSGATVGTGQSAPLNVRITSPAPDGGVTVTLTSSDTSKLTISPSTVQIKAGATAPDTPPQISGAAGFAGEATVAASAGGFYSDRQTIKVIASITFKDQAVSVGPGGVKSFTILLSAPAPTGGLLVQLTSSDESVATVPLGGAVVSAGQWSVDSQVSGGNTGTADITLRANPSFPASQYFSGAGAVLTITVARPSINITTASLPAGTAGANYPTTFLSATGGTGVGYFWSIPTGSLPAGLSLSTSGVISGNLTSSATTSSFTLQVQDSGGNRDTKTFTIAVNSPLTINTASLPPGTAGMSYASTALAASGGTGSGYGWSVLSGALPSGLSLSPGGLISGTLASSAATSTFTVVVQDSGGATVSKQFTLTVYSTLSITTASLPVGAAGASYPSTTLAASGGTGGGYTWSLTIGSLPSGLILSATGVISGSINSSATTSTFTVQVKDSGNNTATRQFTLTVNPALSITTTSLPGGMAGADYASTTLAASGGSSAGYTWSLSAGSLPSGLTLSAAGVLSGTLASNAATSTLTIQVQDSVGATATKQFTIVISPTLTITTASLPDGTAGTVYPTKFLSTGGGSGSGYTWSISAGSLPSGLTLTSGGVLSGTLSSSATTSTFTVQVQDSLGNIGTKQFTVTVNAALAVTTASLPAGAPGAAYTATTLTASGGSGSGYTWSVSSGPLPSGLTLSAAGVISGTLSNSAVTSTFTVQVRDSALNTATKSLTINITLVITTTSLSAGNAGKSYSTLMAAAGGTGTGYTWSVSDGSLPSGLTLSSAGALSGILSASATSSTFTVQVQDSGSNKATRQFSLTVNPPLSITTTLLPVANVGALYPSTTLAATGGSAAGYSWSLSEGALPAGLSLSPAGVISGTLSSSAATSTFTVLLQDSAGNSATRQFTITVETVLTISTPLLPAGDNGSAYAPVTLLAGGGSGAGYTWSIASGSLPSGLTLSAAGVISGTLASSAATSTVTIQVQDSSNNTATRQFIITVNPPLVITTTSLPAGAAGGAYPSTTLAAGGGSGTGYAWTVTQGPLPAGLNLSAGGVLSGTLSASATTSTFTVQVQDSLGVSVTKSLTINVNPALTINTPSLPDGMAGANYPSATLTASGGTGAGYSWSIFDGSLPAGLSLSAGGVIAGTLSSSAVTSTFTVQAQDSASNKVTKAFTIRVNPALRITTAALPSAIAGHGYPTTTLAATGGTGLGYTWTVSDGALPAGLTLSTGGVLSGTLSISATAANVTIQVQDSGGNTATQAFAIPISPALSVTTASLPNGIAGTAYSSTTLEAAGGTGSGYSWSISSGVLPLGLTLTPAGVLSGTLSPSAIGSTFTIQVKDSGNNTATKQFTITVGSGLSIQTGTLPTGIAGSNYAAVTLAATGGAATGYTWSVSAGSLPPNLTLTSAGVLSGSLSASATTSTFTIQVKDSGNNTATKQFTLTVSPALSIAAASLPAGTVGSLYASTTLSASGGTESGYTWSVSIGSLPSGLTLSNAGVISGTVAAPAVTSTFTVQVKDSGNNTATRQFTITINPVVQITTATLPAGTAGLLYPTTTLAASGGTGTGYSWSVLAGTLPPGLTLSTAGALSGTLATTATTSTFTILVQDSAGNSARKDFTLTVTLTITTSALPGGTAGAPYTAVTLAAGGGTGTGYTWSLAGGSLPTGLNLTSGGVISGSLSSSASSSTFTVQVQDSASTTATRQLTITVTTALTINTPSLPTGTAGSAYPNTTLSASGGSGSGYTWSITVGSLPLNLALSSGGVISGTLSASATNATFTVQVKDSGNNTATRQFTLAVNPTLTITTASPLPLGIAGNTYPNTTLTATGGSSSGYTWSVTTGSAPVGLNLSAGGVISGTLSISAITSTFTVQVKDSDNNTATKQFTVPVNPALSITTASPLPDGIAGNAYPNTTLAATGGTASGYTWSVTAGSLPAGLNLSVGGLISGALSNSASSATFTVQVQDNGNNTATRQFTIAVNPALSITTASPLPTGVAGNAYPNTTLAAAGGTGSGYSWSIILGSLPAGLNLSSGGVVSGTLSGSAISATFTVQVKDSGNNTSTRQFTIAVNPALSITTASPLPSGMAGNAYPNTTLAATGGTTSGYTWSITVGSLPAGLSLSAGGVIFGTLSTSAGSATFTVQVKDDGNNTATRQFTITVYPTLSVTTATLPTGIAGIAYPSTTLSATGGTAAGYTWSVTAGSLPTGLNLSSTGLMSGTLSSGATTATFTVQVKDSGNNTATKQFTITVNQPLTITTASPLPSGVAGNAYPNTTLAATGGTSSGYAWSVTVGSLPSGLTLSADGVISGTLSGAAASATFTVQVKDSGNTTTTKQFTIPVNPTLSITTASPLPNGIAGNAYPNTTLAATGGTAAGYAWSVTVGSLPAGLNLSAGGVISGTLSTSAATAIFTVQVKDTGNNTATKQFVLTVNQPLGITTASPLTSGVAGNSYPNTTLAAIGGTGSYTWTVTIGSLPSGLTLSAAGVISGTLSTSAATATFTVQVKDSDNNTATRQFTITVYQPLSVTTGSLPTGVAGNAYPSTTLAATGGTGAGYAWSITTGSLPSGLTLSPEGAISGTLSSSATTSTFTVQVKDSGNNTTTRQFTITVNPALSITTASPLPTGIAGNAYPNTTLAATGGTAAGYTWSVTVGSLPAGLNLSAGGVISGTLSSSATTSTFTVQVQDSGANTATKQFTITVNPALSITTGSLPNGVDGAVYPSTTLAAAGGMGTPYTWSVTVGSLPSGLILSAAGVLSGTLSTSAATSTFTVQVKDSGNNTATRQFTVTVHPAVSITTASLPDGIAGSAYTTTTLTATGGTGVGYNWSTLDPLPSGLTLTAAGVLSGTLLSSATGATFTIKVVDNGGNQGTKQFTIAVSPALGITTASLPAGMAGAAYTSTTLTASGGTGAGYTWSALDPLPSGLTLTAAGLLSGTLSSSAATATFTVQVKDGGNNTATRQFTLTVYPALTITTASLPGGTAGSAYTSTTLAAGGGTAAGYAWSLKTGSLPSGLTLSAAGVISGTLAYTALTSTFTVQVKDSGNFTATKQFTITVTPAPLAITTNPTLPNATAGALYTTAITAVGGTLPYTWWATGLPAWMTLDMSGAACGGIGYLCGTPTTATTVSFSITVTDNTNPTHQSVTQTFTLTIAPVGGIGTITVSNVSVGVNLQAAIDITISPAPSASTRLTITSGNSAAVLLGNFTTDGGVGQLTYNLQPGVSSLQVFAKAVTASSPVTITVAADSGYANGTGTVTVTNSGFVLSGPNGIGSAFTTYENVTTSLKVYAYRLGVGNVPIENQTVRGGLTVNVPVAVAPNTLGSMASPTVVFNGGDAQAEALFTASSINSGNASIIASPPAATSFVSPATGGTLNVTIQQSGFIPPAGVTVGRNLQAPVSIGLNGPAGSDTVVTVTSSDTPTLKFATGPDIAGAGTIQLTIRAGFTTTPVFYAQAFSGSGSVSYTISAPGYGTVTSSMPLGPSGFVFVTPAGQAQDFSVTLGGPDPALNVYTALFDSTGRAVAFQPVAPGANVTATLTSFTPGVGTVAPTSLQIPGGADYASASFHAAGVGTTTITASASGYTGASVKATVTNVSLYLDPVGSVGQFLAAQGRVHLTTFAATDVAVTVTSNNPSLLQLAVNGADPGANSITVTVRAGSTLATFWVYGKGAPGSSGSYTASTAGSASQSDTVSVAGSAVVLYMGSPGNPSCLSTTMPCSISLAGGARTVYALLYQVTTDGTSTVRFQDGTQALAGNVALSVPLRNSAPGIGSMPASVSIAGGSSYGSFSFTPSAVGSTTVSVNNLVGWTAPAYFFGSDLTQLAITVN